MPRPRKCRRVCAMPERRQFAPVEGEIAGESVVLTVDEYEAVRLIDMEKLTQEQAAARMNVSRTTVQQIYDAARGKLAAALVEGRPLRIEGGDFRLCDGTGPHCGGEHCRRRAHGEGRCGRDEEGGGRCRRHGMDEPGERRRGGGRGGRCSRGGGFEEE